MKFYDTCALLNGYTEIFKTLEKEGESFYISNITLAEIEHIKTAANKDFDVKYKARQVSQLLNRFYDKIQIKNYDKGWDSIIEADPILLDNNDSRIIVTAVQLETEDKSLIFVSEDLNCLNTARSCGLTTGRLAQQDDTYIGYKVLQTYEDQQLARYYDMIFSQDNSELGILENEYLVIKKDDKIIDKYVYRNSRFEPIKYRTLQTQMFGEIKPKDAYQELAIDSLISNQLTVLRGPAGSGKSYLALGALFSLLEKDKIRQIIIFCNTCATRGAAKLGYYPGDKNTKLLDSQIGNFLMSKFGSDTYFIEKMIEERKLVLLPLSDCRGVDLSGDVGVYWTEAQNSSIDMMKLALQRCGENSYVIIDGDDSCQVDLSEYSGINNGLKRVSKIFKGQDYYGEVTLEKCYRSRIADQAEKM